MIQYMLTEAGRINVRCLFAEAPTSSKASLLFKKMGFRLCGYNDRYYDNSGRDVAEFYSYNLNNRK